MSNAIFYGILSVLPLLAGSFIGAYINFKEKLIGDIAAFGAGALIGALTFGLMEESFKLGGLDSSVIGFLTGGLVFIIGDFIIIRLGGRGHRRVYNAKRSTGWGIVLAAVLDGLPESVALGISLALNQKIGLLVLVAIILNNLPEAISSAHDLKIAKKTPSSIVWVWSTVAIAGFVAVILGYTIFSQISPDITALFESIAAGAILAMLASTMMPEAYKESGLNGTLATIFGFIVVFIISKAGM